MGDYATHRHTERAGITGRVPANVSGDAPNTNIEITEALQPLRISPDQTRWENHNY